VPNLDSAGVRTHGETAALSKRLTEIQVSGSQLVEKRARSHGLQSSMSLSGGN